MRQSEPPNNRCILSHSNSNGLKISLAPRKTMLIFNEGNCMWLSFFWRTKVCYLEKPSKLTVSNSFLQLFSLNYSKRDQNLKTKCLLIHWNYCNSRSFPLSKSFSMQLSFPYTLQNKLIAVPLFRSMSTPKMISKLNSRSITL